MSLPYNTTELTVYDTIEKGISHRDYWAHAFRWLHVLKNAKIGQKIVDMGCGNAELLETFYRNRYRPSLYVGLDLREKSILKNREKYSKLPFEVQFHVVDVTKQDIDYSQWQADIVVSNELAEHIGKQNVPKFLKNFKACGSENARYYLSTPNYDPKVGAAGNHTYDSGDGRGVAPQELDHFELQDLIKDSGFKIIEKFGTFASQRDYKESLNDWQQEMFNAISKYYDSNLVSNLMAPVVDAEHARNTLWVLERA